MSLGPSDDTLAVTLVLYQLSADSGIDVLVHKVDKDGGALTTLCTLHGMWHLQGLIQHMSMHDVLRAGTAHGERVWITLRISHLAERSAYEALPNVSVYDMAAILAPYPADAASCWSDSMDCDGAAVAAATAAAPGAAAARKRCPPPPKHPLRVPPPLWSQIGRRIGRRPLAVHALSAVAAGRDVYLPRPAQEAPSVQRDVRMDPYGERTYGALGVAAGAISDARLRGSAVLRLKGGVGTRVGATELGCGFIKLRLEDTRSLGASCIAVLLLREQLKRDALLSDAPGAADAVVAAQRDAARLCAGRLVLSASGGTGGVTQTAAMRVAEAAERATGAAAGGARPRPLNWGALEQLEAATAHALALVGSAAAAAAMPPSAAAAATKAARAGCATAYLPSSPPHDTSTRLMRASSANGLPMRVLAVLPAELCELTSALELFHALAVLALRDVFLLAAWARADAVRAAGSEAALSASGAAPPPSGAEAAGRFAAELLRDVPASSALQLSAAAATGPPPKRVMYLGLFSSLALLEGVTGQAGAPQLFPSLHEVLALFVPDAPPRVVGVGAQFALMAADAQRQSAAAAAVADAAAAAASAPAAAHERPRRGTASAAPAALGTAAPAGIDAAAAVVAAPLPAELSAFGGTKEALNGVARVYQSGTNAASSFTGVLGELRCALPGCDAPATHVSCTSGEGVCNAPLTLCSSLSRLQDVCAGATCARCFVRRAAAPPAAGGEDGAEDALAYCPVCAADCGAPGPYHAATAPELRSGAQLATLREALIRGGALDCPSVPVLRACVHRFTAATVLAVAAEALTCADKRSALLSLAAALEARFACSLLGAVDVLIEAPPHTISPGNERHTRAVLGALGGKRT
jgi:hypothetical protein